MSLSRLMHSSYSRLPLIREGAVDEPLGFVHKKERLKEFLAGNEPDLAHLERQTIYQTLAGLMVSLLDRLPVIGDSHEWEGWRLTVMSVEERRVKRVLLVRIDA